MKPSIHFILCEQLRADRMSGAGYVEECTPHLDVRAKDVDRFSHTITPAPLCMPPRVSLSSGRFMPQHGCRNNSIGLWVEIPNAVRAIRDAGCATANRGKLHLFGWHFNERLMTVPKECHNLRREREFIRTEAKSCHATPGEDCHPHGRKSRLTRIGMDATLGLRSSAETFS